MKTPEGKKNSSWGILTQILKK